MLPTSTPRPEYHDRWTKSRFQDDRVHTFTFPTVHFFNMYVSPIITSCIPRLGVGEYVFCQFAGHTNCCTMCPFKHHQTQPTKWQKCIQRKKSCTFEIWSLFTLGGHAFVQQRKCWPSYLNTLGGLTAEVCERQVAKRACWEYQIPHGINGALFPDDLRSQTQWKFAAVNSRSCFVSQNDTVTAHAFCIALDFSSIWLPQRCPNRLCQKSTTMIPKHSMNKTKIVRSRDDFLVSSMWTQPVRNHALPDPEKKMLSPIWFVTAVGAPHNTTWTVWENREILRNGRKWEANNRDRMRLHVEKQLNKHEHKYPQLPTYKSWPTYDIQKDTSKGRTGAFGNT